MLRIKKEVDLKELERFGFIYKKDLVKNAKMQQIIFNGYYKPFVSDCYMYMVDEKTREIELPIYELDTLFDLIQAGFVEKTEVENNATTN